MVFNQEQAMLKVRSPALVVCLLVMLLTGIGMYMALDAYRTSLQTEFETTATTRVVALQRNLDEKLLIMQSMHSLYSIFEGQPQPQFRRFVEPFEQHLDGVRALQWVVPVRGNERDAFEQKLRQQGINDYQITERSPAGDMVRAGPRDLYYAIYPLLPLDPGEASIGFDVASNPVRRNAIERAVASGSIAASGSIRLLQGDRQGESGFMVLDPLFSKGDHHLLGLVMGVFRIGSIVDAVTAQFTPEPLLLNIDDTEDDSPAIYNDETDAAYRPNWWQRTFTPQPSAKPIMMADRHWRITVSAAPGYLDQRPPLGAALVLGSGLLLGFVLSVYLTMRSRHEEHLHVAETRRVALENQLLRSQRLETMGQMVGGIAHDFKNLLHSILGNVELMTHEQIDLKPQSRNHLHHIERAAQRGNSLIQRMLSFSRNERTVPTLLYLPPLVEGTVAMLQPLIPANISFRVVSEKGLPHVLVDPAGFDQVLVNLCINARDAINGSGHIHVHLGLRMLHSTYCLSCKQMFTGEHVAVSLTDSGSGIPAEVLARIFDPFFTTKQPGKGTGLGMVIIHNIVHASGGHILIDTEVGLGTTFHILLPVEDQAVAKLRIA